MNPEPKAFSAQDLQVGLSAQFEREIQEPDVLAFAANSGDFNPLHVNAEYAQQTNLSRRVVHGAFQIGLASALIGMHLPGRDVLLGTVHARFLSPLFYPCRVSVRGEITAWNPGSEAGSVRVVVSEATSHIPVSEIMLSFTLHKGKQTPTPAPAQPVRTSVSGEKMKLVLLTGASGGIGTALLGSLAAEFEVLAMFHNSSLERAERARNVVELPADLSAPDWEQRIKERIGDRALYAVIHCAWPGMPRGGLLKSDLLLLEQQLAFGTSHVVRLADFLFEHADAAGGRLIALGSTAGRTRPALGVGAYSLAKSALEETIKLLAPELARRKITANAVCPSFVLTGMNARAGDLQLKREAALIPMGRVCDTNDIVGAVRYLLSPDACFVSGQSIVLSGAQL